MARSVLIGYTGGLSLQEALSQFFALRNLNFGIWLITLAANDNVCFSLSLGVPVYLFVYSMKLNVVRYNDRVVR